MKQTLNQTVEAVSSYGRSKVYTGYYGEGEWDQHLQFRIGSKQVVGKTEWMLTAQPRKYGPADSPVLVVYKKGESGTEYKYNINYEYSLRFENLLDAFNVRHTAREKALLYVRQLNDAKLREHFLHHDLMVIAAAKYEEAAREQVLGFVYKDPKTTRGGEGYYYRGSNLVQSMAAWAVEVEQPINAYHDVFKLGYDEAHDLLKGIKVDSTNTGWNILRDIEFILGQYDKDVAYALEHGEMLKDDLTALRDKFTPEYHDAQLKEAREHVDWLKRVKQGNFASDAARFREALKAAQQDDDILMQVADLLEQADTLLGWKKEEDDEES